MSSFARKIWADLMAMNGGRPRFSNEITLGQLLQMLAIVVTAVGFWFSLEQRLDVFEQKLFYQAQDIAEIKGTIEMFFPRVPARP